MKRKSKEHMHGAIAKRRIVPKIPLCKLPVDILSHILSQLPINDAIRTSVLSRKWKYVWCNHTDLTFNSATMRKHYFKTPSGYGFLNKEEFITRVDTILHQHSGVGLKHLEFKYKLHNKHADHVDRWVDFAIASKVKELIIDFSDRCEVFLSRDLSYGIDRVREEQYDIPSQLFSANNGSYLLCLELSYVSLQLPADFKGFLHLKTLTLVDVSITDEDVNRMLSNCSLLEFFKIAYCRMVTIIRVPHRLDQLKHLVIDSCSSLQEIELKCSLTKLQYTGTVVPLIFSSTSRLTNVCVKLLTYHATLDYIINGFPSTLQGLKTLTLLCAERERITLPGRSLKFSYLRHLKLELVIFCDNRDRKTDVLEYAHVLEIAPFIEKLELCMWMNCWHRPYRKEVGKLRSRASHQHANLKFVRFSGFFGHKDQVELALHILRSSVILEKMEITPRVEITGPSINEQSYEGSDEYVDGYRVATAFVCKADHRNVVEAVRPSFPRRPQLEYGHGRGKAQRATPRRRARLAWLEKNRRGRHGNTQ